MREPRNPFRLRASEYAESHRTFVRLFSPEALDVLQADNIWKRPQIIRSAPGGGKTSLLRLLTPSSLRTIYALRTREYMKDLFQKLTSLDVIGEDGTHVLGVFLSCAHSFATLDDLSLEDAKKEAPISFTIECQGSACDLARRFGYESKKNIRPTWIASLFRNKASRFLTTTCLLI